MPLALGKALRLRTSQARIRLPRNSCSVAMKCATRKQGTATLGGSSRLTWFDSSSTGPSRGMFSAPAPAPGGSRTGTARTQTSKTSRRPASAWGSGSPQRLPRLRQGGLSVSCSGPADSFCPPDRGDEGAAAGYPAERQAAERRGRRDGTQAQAQGQARGDRRRGRGGAGRALPLRRGPQGRRQAHPRRPLGRRHAALVRARPPRRGAAGDPRRAGGGLHHRRGGPPPRGARGAQRPAAAPAPGAEHPEPHPAVAQHPPPAAHPRRLRRGRLGHRPDRRLAGSGLLRAGRALRERARPPGRHPRPHLRGHLQPRLPPAGGHDPAVPLAEPPRRAAAGPGRLPPPLRRDAPPDPRRGPLLHGHAAQRAARGGPAAPRRGGAVGAQHRAAAARRPAARRPAHQPGLRRRGGLPQHPPALGAGVPGRRLRRPGAGAQPGADGALGAAPRGRPGGGLRRGGHHAGRGAGGSTCRGSTCTAWGARCACTRCR